MLISERNPSGGDLTAETGGSGDTEEASVAQGAAPVQPIEEAVAAPAPEVASVTPQAQAQPVEGRRTQLKIVRETVQSLSRDIGNFRRSHEVSVKRLEKQVASLRKELAVHARSKDLGNHVKSHEADTKRLEKQVTTLRNELVALKNQIAKEAAKSRAREEAVLSKVLAKVRTAKPSKKPMPPAKHSTKKKR
jgi:chromosome segregation ATPase